MLDRSIPKSDYARYTPHSKVSAKKDDKQLYIHNSREYSLTTAKDGYLKIECDERREVNKTAF